MCPCLLPYFSNAFNSCTSIPFTFHYVSESRKEFLYHVLLILLTTAKYANKFNKVKKCVQNLVKTISQIYTESYRMTTCIYFTS